MTAFNCYFLHSILLWSVCLSLRSSTAKILGNETDKLALLAFKSQITLDPFSVMNSWNDSNHFCEWEGVTCSNRHQRVRVLRLGSKDLGGSISPHIGNLSFLRKLFLDDNNINGEIPQELGHLFRLEYLVLSNNSLVGEIPVNIFLCSNLSNLFLNGNDLVGMIPKELGSLSKLVKFTLRENKLTGGIPPSLGNLSSLEHLQLSFNSLDGCIPTSLSQLKGLQSLSLDSNKLSGMFPLSLFNLSTLQVLSIAENNLTGILPSEIGFMLPDMKQIFLGGNQFFGHIPSSLFNASKLQNIEINQNQFTGNVPLNVGNLKDLKHLSLSDNDLGSGKSGDLDFFIPLSNCSDLQRLLIYNNGFGGMLPSSIGNISNQLNRLDLGVNQLSGSIPTEIGNLHNLILLNMETNFFSGSIPMALRNMQNLQALTLQQNQLSGQIPSFIMNMSQLYYLALYNNFLEGNISSALENQNLQILDISFNNFTGSIPKEIGLSSGLLELYVEHNMLNGSLPLEVGNLKNLRYLDAAVNKISGEIPSALGTCSSLQYLNLWGNFFQGTLPSSLGLLKDLVALDVSSNNLSGNIPIELEKLVVLTRLNLSFNDFEGEVPIEGIFKNISGFSIFGNHKICGGIPRLGLPKCHIQRSKKQGIRLSLKVTLGVLISSFIVGLSLVIYLRKKPKTQTSSEQCVGDNMRVSYNDLHKATDGFSSASLIGTGSYGSVYKAILHQDEGPIVVKVFNLMERGASKTFVAECEALRVVRHRNLLKIITVCSSVDFSGKDFKALVFGFMPNGSLESWLHPNSNGQHTLRSLSLYQRLDIAMDVASAVDYLHNHSEIPIVHCDLKPSNVLLDDDFTAHVCDFGLAKFLFKTKSTNTSNNNDSSSVAIRGTIGYIPPESGMGAKVSTQGDVYSYGILLLEMFTGKRPTDHMFEDELSLHDFSKMALPQRVMDIIDMHLLSGEIHVEADNSITTITECLSSIIGVGVACSVDQMAERMNIKDVLKEMHSIKKKLFSSLNA